MNCPKCGSILHLDEQSIAISNSLNPTKWGEIPQDFYRCWGCGFLRPLLWWTTLEEDVNTEVKSEETPIKEEIPEELLGPVECPWGD